MVPSYSAFAEVFTICKYAFDEKDTKFRMNYIKKIRFGQS